MPVAFGCLYMWEGRKTPYYLGRRWERSWRAVASLQKGKIKLTGYRWKEGNGWHLTHSAASAIKPQQKKYERQDGGYIKVLCSMGR